MHLKNDVILTTLTETGGYDDLKNKIKPKLTPVQMYKFHSNRDFVIKKSFADAGVQTHKRIFMPSITHFVSIGCRY